MRFFLKCIYIYIYIYIVIVICIYKRKSYVSEWVGQGMWFAGVCIVGLEDRE